jgi:hypothetical protein
MADYLRRGWMVSALLVIAAGGLPAQDPASHPDPVVRGVWEVFRRSAWRIDRCAVPIALERQIDPRRDWPAFCNDFQGTDVVKSRAAEIRTLFDSLSLSPEQRLLVRSGRTWIGASAAAAEVALGRPERINETITSAGTRQQWIYSAAEYLYIDNGRVTAIQTSRGN